MPSLNRARAALMTLGERPCESCLGRRDARVLGAIAGLLAIGSLIGWSSPRRVSSEPARLVVDNLNARIRSWWVMTAVFVAALATGGTAPSILFPP